MRSISQDGRGDERAEEGSGGSIETRRGDAETVAVTLRRSWSGLSAIAERRRTAAQLLLDHLLAALPQGLRGADLLAETTLGALRGVLEADLTLKAQSPNLEKLLERALLWLHEQEVIRLNKGLAVFRPAMTIHLAEQPEAGKKRRGFIASDFRPLKLHYREQVLQIHVMAEFAARGLEAMADAVRLSMDYFALDRQTFLERWLSGREDEIARETTPEAWRAIMEGLSPVQRRIVADDREGNNVLVLAGPGAGKTRVLVRRIAYLVRDQIAGTTTGVPIPELRGQSAVVHRSTMVSGTVPAELNRRHQTLGLADIHLSYPGRFDSQRLIHEAIRQLSPGDQLTVRSSTDPWQLAGPTGHPIGQLAKQYQPPGRVRSARVHAIVNWKREDSEPAYREGLRCEAWEVVVPEFVFE